MLKEKGPVKLNTGTVAGSTPGSPSKMYYSIIKEQRWARDNTAATTKPCFQNFLVSEVSLRCRVGAKVKIDYFPNLSVKMKGKENLETFRL